MRLLLLGFTILLIPAAFAQKEYEDSVALFLKQYVQTHEVVKGEDRRALQFYPVDKSYRVLAKLERMTESKWINFPTSGTKTKIFKVYGTLYFNVNKQPLTLLVYQSQELLTEETYKNYLFLPFTDASTGKDSYEGGRYIDLSTANIIDGTIVLDFNKAYNPYCAYVSGLYNCPIPPKENALPIAINAGEKAFKKMQ